MLVTLRRLPLLVSLGTTVLLLGAAGDFAFHLSNGAVAGALVGADGYRAHLITLAGMVISVIGLIVRAAQTNSIGGHNKHTCRSVHSSTHFRPRSF
jgi:hypothetical protein